MASSPPMQSSCPAGAFCLAESLEEINFEASACWCVVGDVGDSALESG